MKQMLSFLLVAAVLWSQAQIETRNQKHFNHKRNLALEGYDVVTYFEGKPREGSEKFQTKYEGIIYHFASSGNQKKFQTNPSKYEPAYGGWCAYAMGASGEKVKIDVETYKIVNGKLYLFYNFWGNNTLDDWNVNESKLNRAADRSWKNIIGQQ